MLGHKCPHSYQVQLDDGRIWKRHVDDVLQNTPSAQTTAPSTASPEPTQANATVGDTHIQPAASAEPSTLSHADSEPKEASLCASPELCQSRHAQTPPHRLIEQI